MKQQLLCLGLIFISIISQGQSKFDAIDFQETSSGLVFKINSLGDMSEIPRTGDRLWVHYVGFLENDTLFSSSLESGPLDFYLGQGQVIKGWDEGLRMIKAGGSMVLKIPPHLAYDQMDYPGVPPGSTLYFEIALLQVDKGNQIVPYNSKNLLKQTDSNGLSFFVVEEGEGGYAQIGDNAYVHYSAYLNDTLLFDSSIKKGDPVRITVGNNQIFEGWNLALQKMNEGSKLKAIVPSDLAYGEEGLPNLVPPSTIVTLDLHMVKLSPEIDVSLWDVSGLEPVKLASGLSYYVIDAGEGDSIPKESIVTMHYSGYLSDGNVVDSSVKREEEFRTPVGIGAIMLGWDEALLHMRKGSKYQLHIPSELAYGEEGYPPIIPPNSFLIYDVEIIDFF